MTPHATDIGAVCAAAGAGHERVERAAAFLPAVERAAREGGVRVVEVVVDPELNRARRGEVRIGGRGRTALTVSPAPSGELR